MKKIVLISMLVPFSLLYSFSQTYLPASLTCGRELTLSGSPYIVDNSITIEQGCSLLVDAGVEIQMAENAHLIVRGKVNFLGTALQPIYIHAKDTTWGNILLDSTLTQKSVFDYVVFENARNSVEALQEKGVIYGYYSTLEVQNCHFKNNLRCISTYQCPNIIIKNCIMDSTNVGEKIHGQYCNGALVDGCILDITHGDSDNIDFDASNNVVLTNNYLYGGDDDGFDIGQTDSIGCDTVTISGNYIFNMFNKGISNGEYCKHINVNHNVIVGCGLGIGAKSAAYVVADHNTLFQNRVGVNSYNHPDQIWGPGHMVVTNCIIANSDTAWNVDPTAYLSISYSLADDTLLPGTTNIMGDPMFVSPVASPAGNFHILPGSPAIDAGEIAFGNDPDGTRTDIGRFYLNDPTAVQVNEKIHGGLIYPNPNSGEFFIRLQPDNKLNKVIIMNAFGSIVYQTEFLSNRTECVVNSGIKVAGVYYMKILSENKILTEKFIVY